MFLNQTLHIRLVKCARIGPNEWLNCCRKVAEIEKGYRQVDVAVDDELETVITIDSSTETDFGDYESGYMYEYSSIETTK